MKYLKIRHYISVLLSEGTRWEFEDILNGGVNLTDKQIKRCSWRKRYLLFVPVMIFVLILKKGINSECIGYAIAALSIFIGLFASLVITMYGRYLQIPRLLPTANNDQKIEDKKVRNFIRQFTFVTGKNLLVATVIIALMSLILILPEYMSIDVFESKFISSTNQMNFSAFLMFLNNSVVLVVRFAILYLIFDFFLMLLYSLGALFSFLKREYS